ADSARARGGGDGPGRLGDARGAEPRAPRPRQRPAALLDPPGRRESRAPARAPPGRARGGCDGGRVARGPPCGGGGRAVGRAGGRWHALEQHDVSPGEYLLVTAHRAGNVDDPARLELLVELLEALPETTVFPLHPRTRARLEAAGFLERLGAAPRLRLTAPLG